MNLFKKILSVPAKLIKSVVKFNWKSKNTLTKDDHTRIKELLIPDYYIILTRRSNYLSTYFISFANFVLTGKFSHWSHALMNLENEVETEEDFILIEALPTGTQKSSFKNVFNVHSVALLKPKNMSIDKWTSVLDAARTNLGKPYDTLFDLKNDKALSCVELVRNALKADPDYNKNFYNFEVMIDRAGNLTPQMFYDCPDFEVVYEVRK